MWAVTTFKVAIVNLSKILIYDNSQKIITNAPRVSYSWKPSSSLSGVRVPSFVFLMAKND